MHGLKISRVRAFALALALSSPLAAQAADSSPSTPVTRPDPITNARQAIKREDWNIAKRELEGIVERQPGNADAHNLLGFVLRKQGVWDRSKKHYDEALRLDPKHLDAHEYIGELYLKMKRPDDAKRHLATLEQLCGKNCEQYQDLAKAVSAYR